MEFMPQVVIPTEVYSAMLAAARARMPAETVGALLGKIQHTRSGETYFTLTDALPLRVPPHEVTSLNVIKAAWHERTDELDGDVRPLGWFYADPGRGVFPSRLDTARVHAALALEGNLLLDFNPGRNQAGLATLENGAFVPLD